MQNNHYPPSSNRSRKSAAVSPGISRRQPVASSSGRAYAAERTAAPRSAKRPQPGNGARSAQARQNGARSAQGSGARNAQGRQPGNGNGTRTNSNASNAYSAAPRRVSPHTPPRRNANKGFFVVVALSILVALVIWFCSSLVGIGIGKDTFVKNVYINGISFAGYTKEEGFKKMEALASEELNKVYKLNYQDRSWDFSPSMVGAQMNYAEKMENAWNIGHVGNIFQRRNVVKSLAKAPQSFECKITYDETLLDEYIESLRAEIDVAPRDAEVVIDKDKPFLASDSATGLSLNTEQLKDQLEVLIREGGGETSLPVEVALPAISSDEASFSIIAQFSTDVSFRSSASRSNVRLALQAFNGVAAHPGDVISFNSVVGPRTETAGFQKATEFAGNRTTEGIGGGVCQASTTLYNAVIIAGMDIVDRKQHSMLVSYVQPSQDASVTDTGKDFVFKNNQDYSIYIFTEVTKETATVTIYGRKPQYRYQLESTIVQSGIKSEQILYEDDVEGKHAYYKTDPPVIMTEGKDGCISEGWIVAYDWTTGEEVSRTQVSRDTYSPSASVYWRGVHDPMTTNRITEF